MKFLFLIYYPNFQKINKLYCFPAKQEEILFFPANCGFTSEFYLDIKINECKNTFENKGKPWKDQRKLPNIHDDASNISELTPYWDDSPSINQEQGSS